MPQGVNAIALAENLHSTKSLFFQADDAHMRIYAVADQDKYLIHIYQKLKNERDIFFKLVNCCI